MEVAPFRVEYQQPLRGKNLGIEISKCLRERPAGLIGGSKCVHGVRRTEQLPRLIDEWIDRFVEHHAANGHRDRWRRFVDEFLQLAARWKRDVIDLGEVVVFGRQPENRRMGSARRSCQPGARQRRRRLERSKQRPTKEPHLLPGDNNACSGTQSSECRTS